ncbi:alanine racemase, partial [Rhizobium johnstonii]|uniref:alanine racemase n=1 Tax=Rhizobium johnstonii TaxID=3019933 RepID=UPI003F957720
MADRNGIPRAEWTHAFERAQDLQQADVVDVGGVFSHFAGASAESDAEQRRLFDEAIALAATCGLRPPLQHIAST